MVEVLAATSLALGTALVQCHNFMLALNSFVVLVT